MVNINPGLLPAFQGLSSSILNPIQHNPATDTIAHALLNGGFGNFRQQAPQKPVHQGQSVVSRVLDIFSRPLYAAADAAIESENASANHQGFLNELKGLGTGVIHGLSGTEKNTWSDVLQQGKDINHHRATTGTSAGYQKGEGGNLSGNEKAGSLALNILADPSLAIMPVSIARAAGIKIPTLADISSRAFSKTPLAGEAVKAATNEAGPAIPAVVPEPPKPNLLNINPEALANAKSIPDIVHAKVGTPVVVNAAHPHINIDQNLLANEGRLKATSLTDVGKLAAGDMRTQLMNEAKGAISSKLNEHLQNGVPFTRAKGLISDFSRQTMGAASNSRNIANRVANDALGEIAPGVKAALEHNSKWVAEAIKNGVDPERALQVVKDVQAGADFKTAFEDAVRNSKALNGFSNSKAVKGITDPHFKLSSVLAPTAHEVLRAVDPANPNAVANASQIAQIKALTALKRNGALSRPLNSSEQAIHDDVAQMARNRIAGTNGFKPTGAYNDLAQAMVWNTVRGRMPQITAAGASNIRAINERTLRVVAHIEQTLENEGIRPVAADGTHARITEAVLSQPEFPNKLTHLPTHLLNRYVNGTTSGAIAKAESATEQAAQIKPVVQSAALRVNQIFNDPSLSDPVKHLASQGTAKGVENSIMMTTGSSRAARAGKEIYKAIVANQFSAAEQSLKSAGKALTEIVTTGTIPANYKDIVADLGRSISRSVSDGLDVVPAPSVLGTLIGPQARPEVGFLGRMATWYGQHDLRPIVRARQATSRTNAALWTHYWQDTFKALSPEQRLEAVRIAQGVFIGAANPDVERAAQMIRTRFENLLSSSNIAEADRVGNTVAMRAGLFMDGKYGLNAELRRMGSSLQLTNKAVKDMLGKERDFSQGSDWLNSWEAHKFTGDPAREMARLESAIWNASAKKAIFDDIIDRFGHSGAEPERSIGLKDLPFTRGVFFSPEIAQQITRVVRDLYAPKPQQGALLRTMDNVLRMWKTGVTIYSPSHAIHNGMGDIYNNWIAGVNDVRNYSKALQVMRAFHKNYPGLDGLQPLLNSMHDLPTELAKLSPEVSGKKVIAATKDGQKLTAAQIYMAAHNQGILQDVHHIEDIYDENGGLGGLSKLKPFGGKVSQAAHSWVGGVDHFTRLAHFIHEVRNGRGDLAAIFDNAGRQVRKFHPDGMDLTDFERTTLRRVIPFYSWTRKAIPFTIMGMLQKPGKFMVYPSITTSLNYGNAANINPGQQFPSDQLFPSWITDNGIGPMGGPGGFLNELAGGPSGYVTANLSVPPLDIMQSYVNHPGQGILSGLNPLAKVPLELMQGQHIDTKVPITNTPEYLGEQVPIASLIQRLTNVGVGGVTKKGQQQGVGNQQNFVNFLTGLKLTNTGQYIKQAQYELHQKQTQAKKTNRDNLQHFLTSLNGG